MFLSFWGHDVRQLAALHRDESCAKSIDLRCRPIRYVHGWRQIENRQGLSLIQGRTQAAALWLWRNPWLFFDIAQTLLVTQYKHLFDQGDTVTGFFEERCLILASSDTEASSYSTHWSSNIAPNPSFWSFSQPLDSFRWKLLCVEQGCGNETQANDYEWAFIGNCLF